MTPGQIAYEADCSARPRYEDGGLRVTWASLHEFCRATWERNPTPRFADAPPATDDFGAPFTVAPDYD